MNLQSLDGGIGALSPTQYTKAVGDLLTQAYNGLEKLRAEAWNTAMLAWQTKKGSTPSAGWYPTNWIGTPQTDKERKPHPYLPYGPPNTTLLLDPFLDALKKFSGIWSTIQFTSGKEKSECDAIVTAILYCSTNINYNGKENTPRPPIYASYGLKGLGAYDPNGPNTQFDSATNNVFSKVDTNGSISDTINSVSGSYNDLQGDINTIKQIYAFLEGLYWAFSDESISMMASKTASAIYVNLEIKNGDLLKDSLKNDLNRIGYIEMKGPANNGTPSNTPPNTNNIPGNVKVFSGAFDWVGAASGPATNTNIVVVAASKDGGQAKDVPGGKTFTVKYEEGKPGEIYKVNGLGDISYAGIHLSKPKLSEITAKVGDMFKISSSNWPEAEGKSFPIIRFNHEAGTVILDVPAPVGITYGSWENESASSGLNLGVLGWLAVIGILLGLGYAAFKGKTPVQQAAAGSGSSRAAKTSSKPKHKTKSKSKKSLSGLSEIVEKPELVLD